MPFQLESAKAIATGPASGIGAATQASVASDR